MFEDVTREEGQQQSLALIPLCEAGRGIYLIYTIHLCPVKYKTSRGAQARHYVFFAFLHAGRGWEGGEHASHGLDVVKHKEWLYPKQGALVHQVY